METIGQQSRVGKAVGGDIHGTRRQQRHKRQGTAFGKGVDTIDRGLDIFRIVEIHIRGSFQAAFVHREETHAELTVRAKEDTVVLTLP